MSSMKQCTKCQRTLPLDAFHKCQTKKYGVQSHCRECQAAYSARWRKENPEKVLAREIHWRESNPEKARARSARYRETNHEKVLASQALYREENRERERARGVRYYAANRKKVRARAARYYLDNRERERARNIRYRKENPEKERDRQARYHAENREKRIAKSIRYRKENPEKDRAHQARRKAQKLRTQHARVDYTLILAKYGHVCHICGGDIPDGELHMDHVIPLSRGGTHTYDNIKPAHATCNLRKHAKVLSPAQLPMFLDGGAA